MKVGDILIMPYVEDSMYTYPGGTEKKYREGGACKGGQVCEIVSMRFNEILVRGDSFTYSMLEQEFDLDDTSEESNYQLTF